MIRNQILILTVLLSLCTSKSFAQRKLQEMDPDKQAQKDRFRDENAESWRDKISYGGNLMGGFGSGSGFLLLQPQVFYRIVPQTILGTGITYIYWSQKFINTSTNQSTTISDNAFGLNLFARQTLFGPVFVHAEYMPMNFTSYNRYGEEKRVWGHSAYLGGGYSSANNQQAGFYVLVLYDLLWKQDDLSDPKAFSKTFYASPWNMRFGFMF
jgi:hypothetical protein